MLKSMNLIALAAVGMFALACAKNEPSPAPMAAAPSPASNSNAAPLGATAANTAPQERTGAESTAAAASGDTAASQPAAATGTASGDAATAGGAASANDNGELKKIRDPDVVYVPTPQPVVDKMLDLAKVKQSDVLYDLGCGDGRIVVTAAKRYGVRAFGFDIDPVRVQEARENVRKNNVEHLVKIEQKDIFTLDLSPANVVTLYLLPRLNVKLIPQLQKLKPGSRIVSHDFDMEGVSPLQHLTVQTQGADREHAVYLWHAPIKVQPRAASGAK
jgi:precorrin-6B methylase 2